MRPRPCVAALLLIAPVVHAQPQSPREQARETAAQPPPEPTEAPRRITYSARLGGDLGFSADLDDAGDVTISRARAGFSVNIPAGDRGTMSVGYDYEISGYDFDGATGIIPGTSDPWNTVHTHGLSATYFRRASLRWFWLVGGNVAWSGEEGADFADAMTAGGFGAAQFAVTEKLLVGLGLGVRSRLEDSVAVYPVILVDWTINEHLKLTNEGRPGLTLAWAPDQTLSFDITGSYELRDFRLDESGPLPSGVAREYRLPVSLGVTWTPTPMFTFGGRVGVHLMQRFEANDADGDEVGADDSSPQPFIGLEGRIRF